MNKREYLHELEKALKAREVPDIEEIVAEYEEHFRFKMADGFSEEEIAHKLEKPNEIALQFTAGTDEVSTKNGGKKIFAYIGVFFADLFMAMVFALLYAWVFTFGLFSAACEAMGVLLVLNIDIAGILIPPMPYWGNLVFAVPFMALGVLSAVGTVYCTLYSNQWTKAYARWHKNTLHGNVYPSLSKHPMPSAKAKRTLRSLTILSLLAFGITFVAAFVSLMAYTDFKPFWHALGWFV